MQLTVKKLNKATQVNHFRQIRGWKAGGNALVKVEGMFSEVQCVLNSVCSASDTQVKLKLGRSQWKECVTVPSAAS